MSNLILKDWAQKAERLFSLGVRGSTIKYHYAKVGDDIQCYASTGGSKPILIGILTATEATAGTWADKPEPNTIPNHIITGDLS